MSKTTTNYNIVLPEGTDKFNPLIFNNDAFNLIDKQMFKNEKNASTIATHTRLSSGVHRLIRQDKDTPLIAFVATANYLKGSIVTVDGVEVEFKLCDGTVPSSRAFVTNQSVLCYLNGSILNMISASIPRAGDIDYSNDVSGLKASNVQSAIDEVLKEIPHHEESSNYFEIGNVRVCFGFAQFNNKHNNNYIYEKVFLPTNKPYANTDYSVIVTPTVSVADTMYYSAMINVGNLAKENFDVRAFISSGAFSNFPEKKMSFRWVSIGLIK